MTAPAIALLSMAVLVYEVLLVRAFAIAHFHHFAHMAIGIAMLGFGAAGVVLAMARPAPEGAGTWFRRAALITPALLLAAFAVATRLPLDPTQLLWDRTQWLWLGALYLALAAPMVAAATAILAGLAREPLRLGRLYAASFLGSGAGALLSLAALGALPVRHALAVPAVLAAAAAAVALRERRGIRGALGLLAISALAVAWPPWTLPVSPYKGIAQVEAFPGARRVAEEWGALGWMAAVRTPGFRHAPGLSLAYRGPVPSQTALFVDGETVGATAEWDAGSAEMLAWLPSALPYALGRRDRVLVLEAGGNLEVWSAARHGARRVVAVELHPGIARLARRGPPRDTEITWVVGDARSYVARTRERFDLVTLGPVGGLGASAAGLHALSENFLHTAEAYATFLDRLGPAGVLAVTAWVETPPRAAVRLALTAAEALRRSGASPARSLVVCRSWGTVTVLAKPSGFSAPEIAMLRRWAAERQFDVDWEPAGAVRPPATPRHHVLDDSSVALAARAAARSPGDAARFARQYPFSVAPAVDARPYPGHFLRPASVLEFARGDLGRWLPFAEWGLIALIATLAQSAALAGLLILLPLALRGRGGAVPRRGAVIGYFGAIGYAYMAAEIAAIPPLALLLGHPVYAVSAVLAALLVFSGLGSAWSDRLGENHGARAAGVLALALAAAALLLPRMAPVLSSAPLPVRAGAALAALAPLAVLMGLPFPLGARGLAAGGEALALAWAANGFTSVVASSLAALVALEAGTTVLLGTASAAYLLAAGIHVLARTPAGPSRHLARAATSGAA